MATTTATRIDKPASTDETAPASSDQPLLEMAGGAAADAAGAAATVAGAAGEVAARLPDLTDRSLAALDEIHQRIQAGSDATLATGTALSFGFAVGLLVGGANRILVAVALIPVAMIGLTLLDRAGNGRQGRAS